MKKTIIIVSITILILAILLVPIKLTRNDGGTVEYRAILYKIIIWHEIQAIYNEETGEHEFSGYYEATEFIIFPFNWINNE